MLRTMNRAKRSLSLEYRSLQKEPVEGFRVKLISEDNMFEWEVAIYGPPNTIYEGGYFKAHMKFPLDYPYSPPSIRFVSKLLHPNVYLDGNLCISILHPPFDDPLSGELASERWNPTQNVRTILLSVISLLNEPNTASPANVDASVMYRRWIDSGGQDKEYELIVRKQVKSTKAEAAREGVVVPMTVEDYCASGMKPLDEKPEFDEPETMDFYADDDDDDDDDDDVEGEEVDDDASNPSDPNANNDGNG